MEIAAKLIHSIFAGVIEGLTPVFLYTGIMFFTRSKGKN